MRITTQLVSVIVLCCLCHVQGACASSNETTNATSSCRLETVSFSEVYFTSRAFMGEEVRCRGVLKKIKYGPLVLKPVEGEIRDDEYIVHANSLMSIGIHRCNWESGPCQCNDDEISWQGLDGKTVIVEGVLSELEPGCCLVSEEFMSPTLLNCRITVDGGSSDTNNVATDKKQCVSLPQHAPHGSEYASPCQEFKLTVYLPSGGRYMIHYYSAVLWMAYVGPDRSAYITRPFPLYPLLADKKKIGKVWTMLNGLEKHIFPSATNSRRTSIKCRPKRYSQIPITEIHNPQVGLIDAAKALFDFVYEQQKQKE